MNMELISLAQNTWLDYVIQETRETSAREEESMPRDQRKKGL